MTRYEPHCDCLGGHVSMVPDPNGRWCRADEGGDDLVMKGLSDKAEGLGRFGHHPDPAIDFCIEVETLESRLHQAENGLCKPGDKPETITAVLSDIQRAMAFTVGGDPGSVRAKAILRELEKRALGRPSIPTEADHA